ncbi:sensor histidine kinase [Streptomyces bauhiniae]|uniref:sensor histidine kinase n=1 Tax=Streptomyces bauhiniae TaxID=2340725 RepID=UPI003659570C
MKGWRQRTKIEKVDFYSRGTLHVMSCLMLLVWVCVPILLAVPAEPLPLVIAALVMVLAAGLAYSGVSAVRQALDYYMHRRPAPWTNLAWCGGLVMLLMAAVAGFEATARLSDQAAHTALLFAPVPFAVPLAMVVSVRVFIAVSGVAVLMGTAFLAATGERGMGLAVAPPIVLMGLLFSASVGRPSAWSLSLIWELKRSKDTEARLAVAEERLRFGRDLHDVMGRNLAVIALKSELALQMVRRGRPEAVDQMVEVQRLAQEAQRDVREVVRGSRKADLRVELSGAVSVLESAGVRCFVAGADRPELPTAVHAALGWVVREATTNVLRHGDAKWCSIAVSVTPAAFRGQERVVLTVENNGASEELVGADGCGLAGLRERLAALDGTLEARHGERGIFRLTATVPVEAATT